MSFGRGGDIYLQENTCKVVLTRGQRGGYGWEIDCRGNGGENVLEEIEKIDLKLRVKYTGESE